MSLRPGSAGEQTMFAAWLSDATDHITSALNQQVSLDEPKGHDGNPHSEAAHRSQTAESPEADGCRQRAADTLNRAHDAVSRGDDGAASREVQSLLASHYH